MPVLSRPGTAAPVRAATVPASLPDPLSPGHAYSGEDWILVAVSEADYTRSEALAPFLLLPEPGTRLAVRSGSADQPDLPLSSCWSAHRNGSASEVAAPCRGAVFMYFDPLSAAGQRVDQARQPIRQFEPAVGVRWDRDWFDLLVAGRATPAAVSAWVEGLQRALAHGSAPQPVDRRLQIVANLVDADATGEVNLPDLAARVHCSPEHLRKEFRRAANTPLSRYRMWRRMLRLFALNGADGVRPGSRAPDTATSLHLAGFYDAPHGSRAIRRYLGMSMAEVTRWGYPTQICKRLTDC